MKNDKTIENFPDGSYIETDAQGNRTVVGFLAYKEYVKRRRRGLV